MSERPRWAPDSWVKVILVGSLAFGFVLFVLLVFIRALMPVFNVQGESLLQGFDRIGALFGVALGYVLGSKRD